MVIFDFISVALLVVYIIVENRYLPTVNFELLFAVMGMAMAVLSYLYDSLTSLAISSIVFLLAVMYTIRSATEIKSNITICLPPCSDK